MAGRLARKTAACVLAAGMILPSVHAVEEPVYEAFAKALAPIASAVFGGGADDPGVMVAECTVTDASGKLAAAQGAKLRLALQAPDRLRADVAYGGQVLTACRAGREMWAAPAGPMRALAAAAGIDTKDTEPDKTSPPLIPLALDPQMLVFLPVVFDVKDLGRENIGETSHRVLQIGLLPELQKAAKAEDFTARAWIGPDYRPRRISVAGADYSLEVELDKLTFAGRLPDTAWEPAEGTEVLKLPASAVSEIFEKMLGEKVPGL
jgi:hypothetical protein